MGSQGKVRTLLTVLGQWIYRARWLLVALAPIAVGAAILSVALPSDWDDFLRLGLLQPAVAALLALTVILSTRLLLGRYSNDRRKGVSSASSATIAVRLWAICFALLLGGILLSAVIARLPDDLLTRSDGSPNQMEAHVELNGANGAPAVRTSVEVTR